MIIRNIYEQQISTLEWLVIMIDYEWLWSCDTEDWSNDAEKYSFEHNNKLYSYSIFN